MEQQIVDVAIIGGGMVGMSLALALARHGMQVALIEKMAVAAQLDAQFDGRVSAIAQGSKRILDGLGVWADMVKHAEPITDIRVSDGDSPFFVHYDHTELESGPLGYIVENCHIRQTMHDALRRHASLQLMEGVAVEAYDAGQVSASVLLSNGQSLCCRLLVAADGKRSKLRALAGIGVTEWSYAQTAIVCTITHEHAHDGLAQERFLPAGPFAVLPMTSVTGDTALPYRSSLVWVEPQARAPHYLALSAEEFDQEIRERVGDYLGTLRAIGSRFQYPLTLTHAKRYMDKRLALIGDAAHGIHPIAGQGVNLGFRDVDALSQLVAERFRLGLDIGGADMLAQYQRLRRFDNMAMLSVTDGLNRLFSNNLLPVKLARGLGLWCVDHAPPLKQFFMKRAMGI